MRVCQHAAAAEPPWLRRSYEAPADLLAASLRESYRDLYADRPARTFTCRNLAGATSDMQRVRLPDGRRRRIVQREAARLQSFPDWFEFCGNEAQQFTQIGNAVPPLLAYQLAQAVKSTYAQDSMPEYEISRKNFVTQDFCLWRLQVPASPLISLQTYLC